MEKRTPVFTMDVEEARRSIDGPGPRQDMWLPSPFSLRCGLITSLVAATACYCLWAPSDETAEQIHALQVGPPWWIVEGVVPEGRKKDMGGWTATPFSKDQQATFGIDEFGKVLDQSKFHAAIAKVKKGARPPWWILSHVKPGGPMTNGIVTFSPEQRTRFGTNEFGSVVDGKKFNAACGSLFTSVTGLQVGPPWWIRHHVTPEATKDMGSWRAQSFSEKQQQQFGIDEIGDILDQKQFDAAISALQSQKLLGAVQVLPPWWILEGVEPNGPKKDMGGWMASSFSEEQQQQYGIDEQGRVLDQAKFDAAFSPKTK